MATFIVSDMTCGGCVRGVTNAIRSVDENAIVAADLPTKTVRVDSCAEAGALLAAIKSAGFQAAPHA